MSNTLVIVESPAKCKKIESYLGPGYKCIASFGHIRQLSSLKNIDIHNNFQPTFELIDDKKKIMHVDFLRKEIALSEDIILATDDDREGEAIAWHICDLFGLPIDSTKRIVFHEITENAIQSAVRYPRKIDMNKVHSQQARQILDLLVGFTVTPMLWKYISQTSEHSLSSGRCQTPALRIIYDNQVEINNAPQQKVYNTIGYFTTKCIPFELNKQFENEIEVTEFLEESANFQHIYTRSSVECVLKQPPEPLTTSRIQQVASNEMHISPKETMKLCQTLYEAGYITYMRTDSKKYSDEFIETAKKYITQQYNHDKYIHPYVHLLSNKEANNIEEKKEKKEIKKKNNLVSQNAHEAIRPTNIIMKTIPDNMKPREKRLYQIIWQTTIESCMAPAEYLTFKNKISTYINNVYYSSSSELPHFLGWKIINHKNNSEKEKEYHYFQQLKSNRDVEYVKIISKCILKNQKQHYTEAKLVQLLEEYGIGRPSTFSSLVEKVQERGYVKKQDIEGKSIACLDFELDEDTITKINIVKDFGAEKNKLVIQPLGILAIEFLNTHFDSIFNYDYTKNMENELDKVCKDEVIWHEVCRTCFYEVNQLCQTLQEGQHEKYSVKIDNAHTYMMGKYGPVIKYVGMDSNNTNKNIVTFLPAKTDGVDLKKLEQGLYTVDELILEKSINQVELGQYRGFPLLLKKGKYGLYATWGNNSKSLQTLGNRPLVNITLEEVLDIIETSSSTSVISAPGIIRIISNDISIRQGKYGDYIFYKTKKMTKPLFLKLDGFKEDYKICNKECFISWFSKEHIAL
uniref:DNA topoisomerase n=1 Tax=viral metagenome TaxID=1070528 RepID=A0A6C0B0G6_9ZZZZ